MIKHFLIGLVFVVSKIEEEVVGEDTDFSLRIFQSVDEPQFPVLQILRACEANKVEVAFSDTVKNLLWKNFASPSLQACGYDRDVPRRGRFIRIYVL